MNTQKPIGYYYPDERIAYLLFKKGLEIPRGALPLYENPPPSWQGFSEEEIIEEAAKIIILRSFKGENV